MALVKYGGGITGMSGSIAGNTHARNRSGNYIRSRTPPVNPRSARQMGARATIMMLSEQWRESPMTDGIRTQWGVYAMSVGWLNKLGEVISLTGFNMFLRGNAVLSRIGVPIITDAPVDLGLPAGDPSFSVAASALTQLVTVTFDDQAAWAKETGAYLAFETGCPQSPSRNYFNGPWRYSDCISGITPGGIASPQTLAAGWVLVQGQKIWCRASIVRKDSRLSNKFVADPILVGA